MKTTVRVQIIVSTADSIFDGSAPVHEVVDTSLSQAEVARKIQAAITEALRGLPPVIPQLPHEGTPKHKNGGPAS